MRMIKVEMPNGAWMTLEAERLSVVGGNLFLEKSGAYVAVFPPGNWLSAVIVSMATKVTMSGN